ncbi:MAG: thrombospondin type 3 repeat-containing protein [Flavobacteriales bacterium]|nr:thrombospondin type 3 repeat-containing protein [Flavobacteriales bacterium]
MKKINLTSVRTTLLLVLLLSFSNLFSKDFYRETIFSSSSIVLTGSNYAGALIVEDTELSLSNYRTINNTTFVELLIDDYTGPFFWYTATLTLNIEPRLDTGGYGPAYPIQLTVENNRYGGFGNFIDLHKHQVVGSSTRGARISITQISIINNESGQPVTTVPGNLELKASFESERYYSLTTSNTPQLNVVQNTTNNTIDFSWNSIQGAEEYELEWTWVDNYSTDNLNTVLSSNEINFDFYDFTNNNSRIRTKELNYSISNIYDRGFLLYRIRTIGKFTDPTYSDEEVISNSLYGNWSAMNTPPTPPTTTTVSNWPHIQLAGHQNKLNWQFQSSFAENGKKKEVVSYFDGSLRNRQTVTKINTNEKAIVGEVIYDNEGRPAIEVLPSPINSNAIRFYPNLNKNEQGDVYSYQDFVPLVDENCTFATLGMSNVSGASHYYSEASASQDNLHDFVPKANLFPFSQIIYSNDNTGRVKSKGGVGLTHQIGSGHEMKYFYSVPAQEELNRLFGYYVGNALHYKKNTVIDPNGQLSVSYLDPQGRTIATALAGKNTDSTVDLNDPHAERENFFEDLLNKLNSNDFDTESDNNTKFKTGNFGNLFDGLRYDAQKVFTFEGTIYDFNYSLTNTSMFTFGCESTGTSSNELSYPFVYKLDIDIINDCGLSQLPETISHHFSSQQNELITNSVTIGTINENIPLSLAIGNYGISKKLVVDDVALEVFANDFIENAKDNGCIFAFQPPNVSTIGCFQSCEECASYYNTLSYTSNGVTHLGAAAYRQELLDANSELSLLTPGSSQYDDLLSILTERYDTEFALILEGCMQPCTGSGIVSGSETPPTGSIACTGLFMEITSDVSPGGQYANEHDPEATVQASIDELPLSVFNDSTTNTITATVAGLTNNSNIPGSTVNNWRHPNYYDKNGLNISDLNHYYDETGQISYITVLDQGDGTYNPEIAQGAVVVNGKIEPQYLKNVDDFISFFQTQQSWALSLIKYHPEFHYLDYQLQYCDDEYIKTISFNLIQSDSATEDYTVNSDGFDSFLSQVATFNQASAAGFFQSATVLLQNDPFFQEPHPLDGATTTLTSGNYVQTLASNTIRENYRNVKISMMEQALALNNTTTFFSGNTNKGYAPGIGGTDVSIAKFAYELVRCSGYGSNCDSNTLTTFGAIIQKVQSEFEPDEQDRFWKTYLASYVSHKQRIKDVFINLYAARNGAYNDCIGNANEANIGLITSGIAERYASQKAFVDTELVLAPATNICSANSVQLATKVKRFMMQENMATNGGGVSTAQSNSSFYAQTGICPMVRDLEILLDQSAKREAFAPMYRGLPLAANHPNISFITPALLTEMNGSPVAYTNPFSGNGTVSSGGKTVTLQYTQQGYTLKTIELTIPNTSNNSNLNWNNYFTSGNWKIVKMSNVVFTTYDNLNGGIYNFKVLAKITINGTDYFERVLDGKTTIRLSCNTGGSNDVSQGNPIVLEPLDDPDCDKKEIFAQGLKSLMQGLIATNQIFSNSQTPPFTLPPSLSTYFGATTARWQASVFTAGNPQRFELKVTNGSSTVNTGIIIYRDTQSTPYATPTSPINSVTIGNTDDIENVHTITINWGGNLFNGFIHRVTTNNPIKTKLYFTCCSPCGEYDFDADGIGDNGVFGSTSCDRCDSRINPNCTTNNIALPDTDGDGIPNVNDNCPNVPNPGQENSPDGDGIADACDNCPTINNLNQLNSDNDSRGNACDNCPYTNSENQNDTDNDGLGDVCDCFIGQDKENFELHFKNLLNEIVQINNDPQNVEIIGNNLSFYGAFRDNYLMLNNPDLNRIKHFLDAKTDQCYGSNSPNYSTSTQNTFTYYKNNKFPYKFRWKNSVNNNFDPAVEFYLSGGSGTSQNITEVLEVKLFPNPSPLNWDIMRIRYLWTDTVTNTTNEATHDFSFNISTLIKNAGYNYITCTNSGNGKICYFRTEAYGNDFARIPTNYVYATNSSNSIQNTCPCIPRPPVPVACDEAYETYMTFMSTTFGSTNYEAQYYANRKDYFCGNNLQYLVDGYIDYIEQLQISSTNHAQYITIAEFGATGLNFGFDGYTTGGDGYLSAILAYKDYLTTTTDTEIKNWKAFIITYLIAHPEICPPTPMIPSVSFNVGLPEDSPCEQFNAAVADVYNSANYAAYLESKKAEFKRRYLEEALATAIENFNLSYADREYQYTLYYYDQAGNLIQTVAPKGVATLPSSTNNLIDQLRIETPNSENNALIPEHNFKTQYRYNSLNQLVWQLTPDGGETRFAYDKLGRIVASQNDKQKNSVVELNPSLSLQTALSTEETYVYKASSAYSWKYSGGTSLSSLSTNSSVEHTIRIDENHPLSSTQHVIFGMSYAAGDNNSVDYGFSYDVNGQFRLRQGIQDFGPIHTVINGDKMKITRNNGVIKFYKNGSLLDQVNEPVAQNSDPMYADFGIYDPGSRICEIKIANNTSSDFSYTRYDPLGRIIEAGEFELLPNMVAEINDNGRLINVTLGTEIGVDSTHFPYEISSNQTEVTKTLYDSYDPFNADDFLTPQQIRNTRNRVTAILTFDSHFEGKELAENDTAIFYNYDIHGNVDEMAQRIGPNIVNDENNPDGIIKRVHYEYDLISGNVNKVHFQKGSKEDQFIHRYTYDADNRITSVETSRDGVIWENDATYLYYEHGPLAKVITGDKKVQGTDYAYTLQGWLKTVNSENLAANNKDMGRDGNYISRDAFGFSLSYFDGDYEARQPGTVYPYSVSPTNTNFSGTNLFNGNIKRMITSVRGLNEEILPTQVNLYSYDQLNRIFGMDSYKATEVGGLVTSTPSYESDYTYDKNGNLLTLHRDAPKILAGNTQESIVKMDRFEYNYIPYTNKLKSINDDVTISDNFTEDIDHQTDNDNYVYDEIGQLIQDKAENIDKIIWRVDGKVKSVQKGNGRQTINFFYDGLGNRIAKQDVGRREGTTTTYYSRDAQGNVLGVYQQYISLYTAEEVINNKLIEHHIYGSSRLGIQNYGDYRYPEYYYRLVGDKSYELSNHLGNVLNVISDRKLINTNTRSVFIDTFDRETNWTSLNEAVLDYTKYGDLITTTKPDAANTGIQLPLRLEEDQTVMFNVKVKKLDNFPSSVPLSLEVRDKLDKTVLWSTLINDDVVSGSFTPTVSDDYYVTITANCENSTAVRFSVDDFYAYAVDPSNVDYVSLFKPDVLAYNDYYPFGSLVPNRHATDGSYRYGFQGQEKDDEIKGEGNSLNYTFRMHDPRVGRFFAVDPLEKSYPWYSPYSFGGNKVIRFVELEGLEEKDPSFFTKALNAITGQYHLNRLNAYITKYNIPDENIISLENDTYLVIRILENHEKRYSIFRLSKNDGKLIHFTTSSDNDDIELTSDQYHKTEVLGNRVLPAPGIGGGGKLVNGLRYAGASNKFSLLNRTITEVRSLITETKIVGKLQYGKCKEFAKDFKKIFGGTKYEIKAPNGAGMSVLVNGRDVPLSTTGIHQFVQKTIKGVEYIFDNMNPNGILKSDFVKGLEAFDPKTSKIISGAEIMKTAKEIK